MRTSLLVIALLMMVASAAGIVAGVPLYPAFAMGLLLALALLFERTVYKRNLAKSPGPEWQRTKEAFIDPETKEHVTVYFNPKTGERLYVRSTV